MPFELSLFAADLDDDELQQLTQQLCLDLHEAGLEDAALATTPAAANTRGIDPALVGAILLKAVSAGGAIVALVGVLKAYVQRKPTLKFKYKDKDGRAIELVGDDLSKRDMNELVQAIKTSLGVKE